MTPIAATTAPWIDPAAWQMLARAGVTQFITEGLRYGVVAGLLWLVLHVMLKRRLAHRLIGAWPTARDMRRELTYSVSSMAVFAALGLWVYAGILSGQVEIYRAPLKHGWAWLLLSLPLMLLWHDFYFYWTHRLLHTRWLLRHVHGVHHRSRNPSPWAAYSFHPVEAFINGLVTPLALLVVPLHWSVLLLFSLHQILRNAHGHAAVETMPRGFVRHRLGRNFTTTTCTTKRRKATTACGSPGGTAGAAPSAQTTPRALTRPLGRARASLQRLATCCALRPMGSRPDLSSHWA